MFPPTVQKISSHYFFNSFIALFNVTKKLCWPCSRWIHEQNDDLICFSVFFLSYSYEFVRYMYNVLSMYMYIFFIFKHLQWLKLYHYMKNSIIYAISENKMAIKWDQKIKIKNRTINTDDIKCNMTRSPLKLALFWTWLTFARK